jgi:hypothetical protein
MKASSMFVRVPSIRLETTAASKVKQTPFCFTLPANTTI